MLPWLGDVKPSGEAVEKPGFIVLLEFADSLADRRLGQIKLFGGQAHFSVLSNCDKDFQMANRHNVLLCFPGPAAIPDCPKRDRHTGADVDWDSDAEMLCLCLALHLTFELIEGMDGSRCHF